MIYHHQLFYLYIALFIYSLMIRLHQIYLVLLLITLSSSFQLLNRQKAIQNDLNIQVAFVTFYAIYPDQQMQSGDTIYIRGDSCNLTWTKGIPLKHSSKNQWSTMLACQTSVKSNIKFLLNDKTWMLGPNYWFVVQARANITVYPSFHPAINPVFDTKQVKSAILNNSRKCSIYLPPSYYDNTLKKYSVLLMHDGQNLFDPNKAAFGVAWKIQDTLNDLIGKQKISQMIVVGIWNTNQRNNEYTYSYDKSEGFGGKGDSYLDFIQKQLIPIIENEWFPSRVISNYGYAIGGSSLGGLISCYAVYKRPTIFRVGICMSSSFWWNNQDFNSAVITNQYNSNTVLYLDSGDSGPSQDSKNQTIRVRDHFYKIGYRHDENITNLYYYLDKGGQHNQNYWGKRFNIPIQYLYGS